MPEPAKLARFSLPGLDEFQLGNIEPGGPLAEMPAALFGAKLPRTKAVIRFSSFLHRTLFRGVINPARELVDCELLTAMSDGHPWKASFCPRCCSLQRCPIRIKRFVEIDVVETTRYTKAHLESTEVRRTVSCMFFPP
jgi:hypothetical protein